MQSIPQLIKCKQHTDHRGRVSFVNDFDMLPVRRFYRIRHPDTSIIRGWRGHKVERRWFYVNNGAFKINVIKPDDWETPDKNLRSETYIIEADSAVLSVPGGYATSMQALEPNSDMLVFADNTIDNAANDDYVFPLDYFVQP
nr:WxcM-like domain-containing protein [uncultured Mucilaginibacter sp.]